MPVTIEDSDVTLGDIVEDELTGTRGTVTAIAEHLTGCRRVAITPSTESQLGEETFVYEDQLDVVETVDVGHTLETTSNFDLGERVEDQVTGFAGVVSVVTFNLYNCPRIGVQDTDAGAGEKGDLEFFDEPRLESVGRGDVGKFGFLQESAETTATGPVDCDYVPKQSK